MKLKRWLAMTVLSLFTGFGTVQAQGGLDIKVVVKGLAAEEDCELSVIEGDRSKTISQTKSEEGQINFSSKKAPAGFYYCRLPGKKYFQFLIDKDRKFEIYTSLSRPLKDLRFENSDENEAFQAFFADLDKINSERAMVQAELKELKKGSKKAEKKRTELRELNAKPQQLKDDLVKQNPHSLFVLFLNSQEPLRVPPKPDSLEHIGKNAWAYGYYLNHYWDRYDMKDSRSMRMPGFHEKIEEYMTKVAIQKPDSIIKAADILLNLAEGNDILWKHVVTYVTSKYIEPSQMGQDAIFVHMIDNYHSEEQNKILKLDEATLLRLYAKANKLRPALLGKVAQNIIAPDSAGILQNMYLSTDSAKFTMLFFFSAGCDHCQAATPGVIKLYNDFKEKGVDVFAICTDDESREFYKYINRFKPPWKHTVIDTLRRSGFHSHYDLDIMPEFYLIDADRKFIAKDLNEKQLYVELEKVYELFEKQKLMLEKREKEDEEESENKKEPELINEKQN